jgi:hypothetical protein
MVEVFQRLKAGDGVEVADWQRDAVGNVAFDDGDSQSTMHLIQRPRALRGEIDGLLEIIDYSGPHACGSAAGGEHANTAADVGNADVFPADQTLQEFNVKLNSWNFIELVRC